MISADSLLYCCFDFRRYMADRKVKEKREYVRTELSIQANLVPIDQNELNRKRYLKQMLSIDDDETVGEVDSNRPGLSKQAFYDLFELLIQTNEKINRIMDFLGLKQMDDESLQVIRTVNISGSGISLVITQPLVIGQFLDISLSIPGFPMGVFRAQGEVKRISPLTGRESHLYEVGIQFLNLNEHQRERLISFTFRQQRQMIRRRKDYA